MKTLIPGNKYTLRFKNGRIVEAEYGFQTNSKHRFTICDSATLTVCEWDFEII